MTHPISRPTRFVVEDYAPALSIDFREPADATDLDTLREALDLDAWRDLDFSELVARADAACRQVMVSDTEGDFTDSLRRFAGAADLERCLTKTATSLTDVGAGQGAFAEVRALLDVTGVTRRAAHFPVSLRCHDGRRSELGGDATHFGYVLDGELELIADGRRYPLYPNSYFSVPDEAVIEGAGRVTTVSRHGYRGLFSVGGVVEPWGRLRYIDGCTDTMLVPPTRLGDPCLNALYFPARTRQTQHVHPSLRAGVVIAGRGTCKTPTGDHELVPGRIFFLPPETWHAFHTEAAPNDARAALVVLAFHPDSDFGPTDDDHPMLNRTYFQYLHRLRSVERRRVASASARDSCDPERRARGR
jgi:AraC-like ligand binding domain